jgi:hypothetical protein
MLIRKIIYADLSQLLQTLPPFEPDVQSLLAGHPATKDPFERFCAKIIGFVNFFMINLLK